MKKLFISLCFIAASLSLATPGKAQNNSQEFRKQQLEGMEAFLSSDSILTSLYALSKVQQYDSIIVRSKSLLTTAPDNSEYMAFLGAAYYNKGEKDSAYYYTLNFIKNKRPYTTLEDILMYDWYPCFYPICRDTQLHEKMLKIFINKYQMNSFPKTELGIELIKLAFKDQRIRSIHSFERGFSNNQSEVDSCNQKFKKLDTKNREDLMAMYRSHPEFITKQEVGQLASNYQGILILHVIDSIPLYGTLLPMLKRAMDKGQITPDFYVEHYTHHLSYDFDNRKMYRQLKDSLCKVYGCKNKTIYH